MNSSSMIFAWVLVWHAALAQTPDGLFSEANALYGQNQYTEAAALYERILDAGAESWQVYYNLGNAYYRLNKIGPAIVNYERALRLNADNEDIRHNLDLANLAVVDRISVPPRPGWLQAIERVILGPAFSTVMWWFLGLYGLFMLGLTARLVWSRARQMMIFRTGFLAVTALLVVFSGLFAYRWYWNETNVHAVILQNEVGVTSGPADDATEVFALHEGTKLKVEQQVGEWVRIRLVDGKVGWVPEDALEII